MARARNIKPSFYTNDQLAELPPLTRILFSGLWCIADREGRLEDRPKKIKAEVLPYDDCNVDSFLSMLHDGGFIIRYSVDGSDFIQITNFSKHQNPHKKEATSLIPEYSGTSTVLAPCMHHASTVQGRAFSGTSPADSLNLIPDSGFPSSSELSAEVDEDEHAELDDEQPIEPDGQDGMSDAAELVDHLIASMQRNNPSVRVPEPGKRSKWIREADRMLRIDRRSPEEVRTVIDWCQNDGFWRGNILSPGKLREKYDQLLLHSKRKPGSPPGKVVMMRSGNFEQRSYDDAFFDQLAYSPPMKATQ